MPSEKIVFILPLLLRYAFILKFTSVSLFLSTGISFLTVLGLYSFFFFLKRIDCFPFKCLESDKIILPLKSSVIKILLFVSSYEWN